MNVDIESLKSELESIMGKMTQEINNRLSEIQQVCECQRISATNLIQYLTLRQEDIRLLQDKLHIAGLSSLASSESHILRQVQSVLLRLGKKIPLKDLSEFDFAKGNALIKLRSNKLFGTKQDSSIPYLMVTFDSGFEDNYEMVKDLLTAGMNVARINCAHDDKSVWKNMIDLLHRAREETGIPCKIYMDIAGPKMRTTILGKGRNKGKVTLKKGQEITLAEKDAKYDPSDIVIALK